MHGERIKTVGFCLLKRQFRVC